MFAIASDFLALAFFGALVAEGAGYVWHRWACHMGVFGNLFRSRHYDHHIKKYPVKKLHSRIYKESCEVAFHPVGVVSVVVLIVLAITSVISWVSFAAIAGGGLAYGIYGLGGMHTLYHLDDEVVQGMWLFRARPMWRMYAWIRDYHLVHHFLNKNYAILLPIFDIVGGSYLSPSELPALQQDKSSREDLFPNFNARLSSSCGEPLPKLL